MTHIIQFNDMQSAHGKSCLQTLTMTYFQRKSPLSPYTASRSNSCLHNSSLSTRQNRTQSGKIQKILSSQIYAQSQPNHKNNKRTLKERINQKLSHKATKNQNRMTLREEANIFNQNKQNIERQSCIRKMLFEENSNILHPKHLESKDLVKGINKGRQNKMGNRKIEKKQFEDRQKRLIQVRKQKTVAGKEEMLRLQMRNCTFRPKITKYQQFI